VDGFRRSEFVPGIVDEAIRFKLPAIWIQEGDLAAGRSHPRGGCGKARQAGIFVAMDRRI